MMSACGARTGLPVPPPIVAEPAADAPLCVELPEDRRSIEVPLQTTARLRRADVVFLLDVTASMGDEVANIRRSLSRTIAPAIQQQIPDAELGVATFSDFPVAEYGTRGDVPFRLRQPLTSDVLSVQGALDAIELEDGLDLPEAQVPALHALFTGEGLGTFVQPSFGCSAGGLGYPCFRADALPIVLLFTDAAMHNGPAEDYPYEPGLISPPPPDYAMMLQELRSAKARVLGFNSGDAEAAAHLRQLASDASSFDNVGEPLVFEIGERGTRLGLQVVQAIETLVGTVLLDVDATYADAEKDDGFDAATLVEDLLPARAEPSSGVQAIDRQAKLFRGVVSGTLLVFELRLRAAIARGDTPRRYRLEVRFRGDGRTLLGIQLVDLVIPARDGSGGCIARNSSL